MKFNVAVVCPEGYKHGEAIRDYAQILVTGLKASGYETSMALNTIDYDRTNIILAAHLLPFEQHTDIPSDSIIVNLEQLESVAAQVSSEYLNLLKTHVVWDYSKRNIEFLRKRFGVEHAIYLPVSSDKSQRICLESDDQQIDVIFYGVLNARRRAILNQLDKAGLKVKVLVGVYGSERDRLIAQAKVVLSVSYYGGLILESTRVLDAMTKGKAVVAECNEDTDFDDRMKGGSVFCGYDDLVEKCNFLVEDEPARKRLELAAHEVCKNLDITETIKPALASLPMAQEALARHKHNALQVTETTERVSLSRMLSLFNEGEHHAAEQMAIAIIASNPEIAEAWHVIGAIAVGKGDLLEAETAFRCTVTLSPESPEAHENLARVLVATDRLEIAQEHLEKALQLAPASPNPGELLLQLLVQSRQYQRVLNLGQDLLADNPRSQQLLLAMARAFRGLDQIGPACKLYLAAVACDFEECAIQEELAGFFFENGRIKEALAFFADLVERDAFNANAYHGLGVCYQLMGHTETALEIYQYVLNLNPQMLGTLRNISHVYHVLMRPLEAIEAVSQVVKSAPEDLAASIQLAFFRRHIGDWSESLDVHDLLGTNSNCGGASPFQILPMMDDPEIQLRLSECFRRISVEVDCSKPDLRKPAPKIRVGFFGSDFHDHATLVLMSGMFREYDKSQFEYFVYSYGVKRPSALRSAVEEQVDVFHDLESATDGELISLARKDDLDIAIDLKGFTHGGRMLPFEKGIAPIQISFLGYPGTTGRACFDYMIADEITVPVEMEHCYSEQIMSMPHTYQPNDFMRVCTFTNDAREDHGLPSEGFVFCCFNNAYKISNDEFEIWMRLLRAVPGSVLWLLDANEFAKDNLRREAGLRGVSAERLVFAPRVSVPDHLSRHQHADLFLDTFNVNAHTTCSDALWAGLPVVTKLGRQFAARVSGSLLQAAGLPDLVCETADDYESLALELAQNPVRLKKIKSALTANKQALPLFDTKLYMRNFESLLIAALHRARNGLPPCRLSMDSDGLATPNIA